MTLSEKILELKKEKNAIVLAHFYQDAEIQEVADFVGDSLALAKYGANVKEDIVVLCGVKFMAETAKILAPNKKVLIPRMDAGCPMADMASFENVKAYVEEHPEKYVVSYVNTTAAVKTLTDICVTSSNALSIINKIDAKDIIFIPDQNLGGYIREQVNGKEIDLWPGYCLTHHRLQKEEIEKLKKEHPEAKVAIHPECNPDAVKEADFVGSTAGILAYVRETEYKEYIIATEAGILHPLRKENPDKKFYLASPRLVCQNMKKITIEDLYDCLVEEKEEMFLDMDIIEKAKRPLDRMLELS